jgi:hypothetical protein
MRNLILIALPLTLLTASSCTPNMTPAQSARDAMTRACVATVSLEALANGRQLPPQVEQFCSDPELQTHLIEVVNRAVEFHDAIKAVRDHVEGAGADAGAR